MPLPYTGKHGELNFEADFIEELKKVGWEKDVLKNYTEKDLIENWRKIIFDNNKSIDKLNDVELSDSEMNQIMDYVRTNCNTPVKANIFINGKDIPITRDSHSKDTIHAGKQVYLNIFSPEEIAGGKTRYQIAEQIIFDTSSKYNDRRGDVILLINGIPMIHIELKASDVPISEATNQIKKYAKEGIFTGLFSLIQVFFAMSPEDVVYFANPGEYTNYNESFFFHWGDKNNNPIYNWKLICRGDSSILSIPEAHKLIGYYVVADKSKDVLKIARSYQYHAINAILNRVKKQIWSSHSPLGGYVWCTTGGGKTMTSFKVGQLIIDTSLADKVVFVVDRVELNNQSVDEYNSFARAGEPVQETTSTTDLFNKLKNKDFKNSLIVTSIQKLSRINDDASKLKTKDLDLIKSRRIVFIIDEAHRSQFGEMHEIVKKTFENALFIGFTGTPIFSENEKEGNTTETVFGDCLSVYSIANGIKDGNVLGFDPKAVKTYQDQDLKERVALAQCDAKDKDEAKNDSKKYSIYRYFTTKVGMVTTKDKDGKEVKGIEDYLPSNQYNNDKHRNAVVSDILEDWDVISLGEKGTKFHAILSTSSIPEAIEYYNIFKNRGCDLNVTALFDPNIDNSGAKALIKEDALIEIVDDYNKRYGKTFDRKTDPQYKRFKKDIINRLSHKEAYKRIRDHKDMIDILIVIDQMLTGFDSQYVNTLYLDRILETDNLIQAISRTNRVYDREEKQFGIFKFYRKPYTMQKNLDNALRLYCEGNSSGVRVANIDENITTIKIIYDGICKIFANDKIVDFCRLPKDDADCQKFKKEFSNLKILMNSVKLQGFKWDNDYGKGLSFNEETYKLMEVRYDDLSHRKASSPSTISGSGYNLNTILSEIAMEKIDAEYLESHFKKVILIITDNNTDDEEKQRVIEEIQSNFGSLSEVHQTYAQRILEDIKNGILIVDNSKTLTQYIYEYMEKDRDNKIEEEANLFDLDANLFKEIVKSNPTNERDLNDCGRFTKLVATANMDKVKEFFFNRDGIELNGLNAKGKLNTELKNFIFGDNQGN